MKKKEIKPVTEFKPFSIEVPGSKSYSNRALVISALAEGKSVLKNLPLCDDTLVIIHALKNLGIKMRKNGNDLEIIGNGGRFQKPKKTLNVGNSGTAMRFLTALLTLTGFNSKITGIERMKKRPIQDLVDALNQLGAKVKCKNGCPPVEIMEKKLLGGKTTISGELSSQFISALLMSAPYAKKQIEITVGKNLTSASYIDTTIDIMKSFGVNLGKNTKSITYEKFIIRPNQKYKARKYNIPMDASSLSYFLAIAAIHGTSVKVKNFEFSMQGDFQFLEILKKMGCDYTYQGKTLSFFGTKKLLALGDINVSTMPDSAMTLSMVCACSKGKNHLTGLKSLRFKETDRLNALETELQKIGCRVKKTDSSLEIDGDKSHLHGATIETYCDHRMAMCFAVLGTFIKGIKIKDPDCVAKTYPNFWKDLAKIGITFIS